MASGHPPSLAEHVCLTLVTQGVEHGWALGTLLAPDGEVGRVWSLTRPLTYRAVDGLVTRRLLSRHGTSAGRGRERTLLRPTAAGRRKAAAWLDEPVAHLRDVRTELLLKVVLRGRAGLEPAPLLAAQQALFAPVIDSLVAGTNGDDLVALWRRENARAVRRFLEQGQHPLDGAPAPGPLDLRLSARNQLRGRVTAVTHGEVMSTVKVVLPDGQRLTAAITKDAVVDLDLAPDDDVVVIVKSTEVMVAKPA